MRINKETQFTKDWGNKNTKMAKTYFWLKLQKGFFNSLAMKKLRRIAGGDTFTIIYLKMQLLSLQDVGHIYYEGVENSLSAELSLALDEDEDNIKITLEFLKSVGLVEQISQHEIFLTEVPHLVGKETEKAELMRRKRQQEKVEKNNSGNNVTKALPNSYTEKEIDKDKDKEKKEKEKKEKINYQEIVDLYNQTCQSFPKCTKISEARKKAITARLKAYSVDDFKKTFEKAEASSFLKGKNDRNWTATFDWMLKDCNMAKILDGNYDNRQASGQNKNNFNNFQQNNYNFAELEKKLLDN